MLQKLKCYFGWHTPIRRMEATNIGDVTIFECSGCGKETDRRHHIDYDKYVAHMRCQTSGISDILKGR